MRAFERGVWVAFQEEDLRLEPEKWRAIGECATLAHRRRPARKHTASFVGPIGGERGGGGDGPVAAPLHRRPFRPLESVFDALESPSALAAQEQGPPEAQPVGADAVADVVVFGEPQPALQNRDRGRQVAAQQIDVSEERVGDRETARVSDVAGHAERLTRGRDRVVEATEGGKGLGPPRAKAHEDRIDQALLLWSVGGDTRKEGSALAELSDGLLDAPHVTAPHVSSPRGLAPPPMSGHAPAAMNLA